MTQFEVGQRVYHQDTAVEGIVTEVKPCDLSDRQDLPLDLRESTQIVSTQFGVNLKIKAFAYKFSDSPIAPKPEKKNASPC